MKQRIELLDLWRSLAVCIMVVFHALYDLELFGVLAEGTMESLPAELARWFGAGSFIFISGAVVRFSANPIRRGFFVFCCGFLVAAVTAWIEMPVKFGILQLLGVCMIVYGLLREWIELRQGRRFALVCFLLFVGSCLATSSITVDMKWLYPLGLRYEDFYSADYFPLFPWLFLFLLGTSAGKWIEQHRELPLLRRSYPVPLCFPGKHSLVIYLLHQPIFYGLCMWMLG